MPNIDPFEEYAEKYEAWFDRHPWVYQSELEAVKSLLPVGGSGIEIGVGSGCFAGPLGIRVGVDPSASMRALAERRGIKVLDAKAEKLPFDDSSFDFALMVTAVCFLDDVVASFREVSRILRPKGVLVTAFIDKDSSLGKQYQERKNESKIYHSARFYSVGELTRMAQEVGFKRVNCVQTLFGDIQTMDHLDPVKEGCGQGAFVVIKLEK